MKIEFVVNLNETAVYALGFCVGFEAADYFELRFFAFGNEVRSLGLLS